MRRPGIAALLLLVVPLLLVSGRPAHADGLYITEAVGVTRFDNELSRFVDTGAHVRVGLGYRFQRLAFTAWLGGEIPDYGPELFNYGLDAKYLFPISKHLEVYLRGSMSRLEADDDYAYAGELSGYGGRGLGVGAGAQLKGRTPAILLLFWPAALACAVTDQCHDKLGPEATLALFVDNGYDYYRLHGPGSTAGYAIDGEARRFTFGIAVGSDF